MSSDTPDKLHPIMVVEDRYHGIYSGGRWWAVACATDPLEAMIRIQWLLASGPGADDVTCAVFWSRRPPWIAIGRNPDEAIAELVAQPDAATNEWTPPAWEDDPSAAGLLSERLK